jgi:hypothetical protein
MPKQKDLKRLVRDRMAKTGESYTAARAQLLKRRSSHAPPPTIPKDAARLAGMSDGAVQAKTGRTWTQWVRALDAIDAHTLPHRDIARHLQDEHELSGWWAQTVTVGYERIRGLRDVGQRRGGAYEANKSKTVAVPVARLYRAWLARERARWLPGINLTIRKATPQTSLRITWPDGTSVQAYFVDKGPGKSAVQVQHTGLASRAEMEKQKIFWGGRLLALAEALTS